MSIKIYFGVPGSGKTTNAARIVLENLKKGIKTYSNVPIKGALLYDTNHIGQYDISDGDMIIDEAGIHYNSRKYKELPKSQIEWFKLSRHYGIRNIHIFSQSYEDMDITLRRLADEIYVVKRTLIPFLFNTRRIMVKVGIDKETHQIQDQYFFQFLGIKAYFGFHYWHMFDSWTAPVLPIVDWYYSSFADYTIDKKHSKIIYRRLYKEGRLYYKIFRLIKMLFSRKNNTQKSARIKTFHGLSRMHEKLKAIKGARARSGPWEQAAGLTSGPVVGQTEAAENREAQKKDEKELQAFIQNSVVDQMGNLIREPKDKRNKITERFTKKLRAQSESKAADWQTVTE